MGSFKVTDFDVPAGMVLVSQEDLVWVLSALETMKLLAKQGIGHRPDVVASFPLSNIVEQAEMAISRLKPKSVKEKFCPACSEVAGKKVPCKSWGKMPEGQ